MSEFEMLDDNEFVFPSAYGEAEFTVSPEDDFEFINESRDFDFVREEYDL